MKFFQYHIHRTICYQWETLTNNEWNHYNKKAQISNNTCGAKMHKLLAQNSKSHFSQSHAVHTARTDTYELGSFLIHRLKWPTALTHAPKNEGHKPALTNKFLFDTFNVKRFPYHSSASMKHILHRDSRSSSPDGHSRPPQHPSQHVFKIYERGKIDVIQKHLCKTNIGKVYQY